MTNKIKLISPAHALILIMDPEIGVVPDSMARNLVSMTSSCVAVGTQSPIDGPTRICFSTELQNTSNLKKVFCGFLETPNKVLKVCDVNGDVELETFVTSERTRVEVWVDDLSEPQNIEILVQEVSSGLS